MITTTSRPLKDLFIGTDYVPDEKIMMKTAQHRLSPNFANWPIEILKVLGEDYPWVTEGMRPASVDIEKTDQETGTGYGGIVVWAQARPTKRPNQRQQPAPQGPSIIIPFMVRAFMMTPLDLFITGKQVLPLTAKRVQESLLATNMFQGLDRSQQDASTLGNQLSPPPEAFYGQFGGQGGGGSRYAAAGDRLKTASANYPLPQFEKVGGHNSPQDSIILNQILPTVGDGEMKTFSETVYRDPATLAQFVKNQNVAILDKIVKSRPIVADDYKNITRWGFAKNVLLFQKESAGRWVVLMYNDRFVNPDRIAISEKQLLEKFSGRPEITEKLWNSNGFVVTVNHKTVEPKVWHDSMIPELSPVHSPGVWYVVTDNKQCQKGFAWKGFCNYNENRAPYTLWYDGTCFSIQEDMQGEKIEGEKWEFEEGAIKEGVWGTFLHKHEDGSTHPTMPFKPLAVYKKGVHVMVRATDMFGHDVNFIVDPGVQKMTSAAGVLSDQLGSELGARAFFIPNDAQFVTLGSQKIRIIENAREVRSAFRDTARGTINAWRDKAAPASTLVVTCTDQDEGLYRIEGNILEPFFKSNAVDCNRLKTKWALVMLGCSVEKAGEIVDKSHRLNGRACYVMGLRAMKSEANQTIEKVTGEVTKVAGRLRRSLQKEAAYIRDPQSVDALLSLNFVNPNNLIVFLHHLDKFQEVEGHLAKLLLMTRFGLEAIPENAVSNALKNLNVVNEGLEQLQGVIGNQITPEGEMVTNRPPSPTADSTL